MTDETTNAEPSGASGGSLAWIPVTERLPDENTDVLVSVDENSDDCGMHVCDYYDGKFSRAEAGYIWGVTHWMPLPAPPTDAK